MVPFIALQQTNQSSNVEGSNRQSTIPNEDNENFKSILVNGSNSNVENINEQGIEKEISEGNVEHHNYYVPNDIQQRTNLTSEQIGSWLTELQYPNDEEQINHTLLEKLHITNGEASNSKLHFLGIEQEVNEEISDLNAFMNSDALELADEVVDEEIKIEQIIPEQVATLIDLIRSIISNSDSSIENLKDIASRLLPIIEQWNSLKQQTNETDLQQLLKDNLSEDELDIWKFIENNVDKRNQFMNHYRQDAQITRTDLANWLHAALERYGISETKEPIFTQAINHSNRVIPMSEVQQYTIHLQSLDRVERIGEELTQRLINIVKESRFTTRPGLFQPMQQLTIVLKPEHLGNITVRLTQIDGNMTVNMIVTSQATKELLEANINQLKHMFSPHQVTIERDETISDEEFFKDHEEKERNEDRNSDESNESTNRDHDDEPEIEFHSFIDQLIQGGQRNE